MLLVFQSFGYQVGEAAEAPCRGIPSQSDYHISLRTPIEWSPSLSVHTLAVTLTLGCILKLSHTRVCGGVVCIGR